MRKLAKYLKPYKISLSIALLLLFGQAMSELSLPNFMSDLVNIGLQQGGIRNAAPDVISTQAFETITAYMPEDARTLVHMHYHADPHTAGQLTKSPDLHLSPEAFEGLEEAFSLAAYSFLQRLSALAGGAWQASGHAIEGFDIQGIYQAHEMLQASSVYAPPDPGQSDMFARQTGILFAKAYYQELGIDTSHIQNRYILQTGLYMLLFALAAGAATVTVGYLAPKIAAGAARDLRRDLFARVEMFSHHEFDKISSASLITRCTNDVGQVQMLVAMGLRMLCFAPIMGIGGIIMAVNKSVSMSWIIALAVVLMVGLASVIVVIALPKFKAMQKLIDRLNKVSREILGGLMVVRAFSTQRHEIDRFDLANRDLTQINLFIGRVMAVTWPLITFIMSASSLLVIWVGASQIAASHLQIGDMMAFMQYVMQVIISFMLISMMLFIVPRASVSAERISEVLEMPLSVTDPPITAPFEPGQSGVVTFENVSFRHHNAEENALTDISFTALPGQTTAIIGATGSGKSTLANLLLRFYDVTQGSIRVNGVDIRQVGQADLRGRIGYVPQKGQLMSGTIADNIRYGKPDASDGDLTAAAQVAQAEDFIAEKDNGFDFEISQGGVNVSGGQRQRLAIARALAKNPEILIFDDSFSALDFKTDARLRQALKAHTANATVLVIAQRVGTIINADQILVLDEGRIVGQGTHARLLETCAEYAEIASSQLQGGVS